VATDSTVTGGICRTGHLDTATIWRIVRRRFAKRIEIPGSTGSPACNAGDQVADKRRELCSDVAVVAAQVAIADPERDKIALFVLVD
jgi:hypothetical protein